MKKSEAVDKIRMKFAWMNTTFATVLVNFCVKDLGMLPPEIINPKYDPEEYILFAEHPFLEYEVEYKINEWEKE